MDFIKQHKRYFISGGGVLVLLIAIIIYVSIDRSHKFIYKGNQLFYNDKQIVVGFENLKPSEDNIRYTFSAFIRVNNLDGNTSWGNTPNSKKYIINNYGSPNIVYYRNTGMVVMEVAYKSEDGVNDIYEFEFDHFPMQKWVQLCIVVEGRYVEVYKNGELYTAKKLNTVPWKSQKMLNIGNKNKNFNGHIGLIDYYNRILTADEVKKLYNKRIKRLPKSVLTYEQSMYLDNKDKIIGKVTKIKKV